MLLFLYDFVFTVQQISELTSNAFCGVLKHTGNDKLNFFDKKLGLFALDLVQY